MKIAVIQLCSKLDYQINIQKIRSFLDEIKKTDSVDAVFLPEVFYSMSDGIAPTPYLVEEDNEHWKNIRDLAIEYKVALIGGSVAYKDNDKILNRAINFDKNGELLGVYDKRNLFKVSLGDTTLNESNIYTAGSGPLDFKFNDFHIGISICFDLRFPELYRDYFKKGVNLISVSAAFTVPTGKAHWESLLRARAIENQSYVVAAGQWGEHNAKIKTFGHSMIIDPWGEVIAQIPSGEGFKIVSLSKDLIDSVRRRMDVSPS